MMPQTCGSSPRRRVNVRFRHRRGYRGRIEKSVGEEDCLLGLDEGEQAVVIRACGGCGLVRRLTEMGLTPGVEVRLLRKCPFHGPVKLEVRGVELALGYGVASKVLVRPLKAEA